MARTLADLAGTLPPSRTERAIDSCLNAGTVSLGLLGEVTAELRRLGRPGIALLGRLLDERGEGYVAPASELERRFLALLRAAELREPIRQVDVGDAEGWAGRVDFAWDAADLSRCAGGDARGAAGQRSWPQARSK